MGFVDGRKEKWGKTFLGRPIVSYDSCKTDFNILFIIGLNFLGAKQILDRRKREYVIVKNFI